MRESRQAAALLVLVVAALASLATSEIPRVSAEVHGDTYVETERSAREDIDVHFTDGWDPAGVRGSMRVSLRGTSAFGSAAPLEARLVRADAPSDGVRWEAIPFEVRLHIPECKWTARCSVSYRLELRVVGDGPAFVAPWEIAAGAELRARTGSLGGMFVTAEHQGVPLGLGPVAAGASIVGALILMVALALMRLSRRVPEWRRVLELLVALAFGVAASVSVLWSSARGFDGAPLGVALLIVGLAVFAPALRSPRPMAGLRLHLVALLVGAVPLVLLVLRRDVVHRPDEVVVAFVPVGMLAGAFGASVAASWRPIVAEIPAHGRVAAAMLLTLTAGVAVLLSSWATLIAAGATSFAAGSGVIWAAATVLLITGAARWFARDSVPLRAVGLALALSMLPTFALVTIQAAFFLSRIPPEIGSLLAVFIGGCVIAAVGAIPEETDRGFLERIARHPVLREPEPPRPRETSAGDASTDR